MNSFSIIVGFLISFFTYCQSQTSGIDTSAYERCPKDHPGISQLHNITINSNWTIKNFDLYEASGLFLESPSHIAENGFHPFELFLQFKPNGETSENDTISIYLKTKPERINHSTLLNVTVSILNKQQKEANLRMKIMTFNNLDNKIVCDGKTKTSSDGWSNFIKKDDYFRNELLSNNALTISYKIDCYVCKFLTACA